MPLFAHVGREKLITPPPLSVPLELIKFCGSKTKKSLFKVLRRRIGLVFAYFAPQNRQKREGSRGFVRMLRFCLCVWGFREKLTHRRPELIKFPMAVARHEKKTDPAMTAKEWVEKLRVFRSIFSQIRSSCRSDIGLN